MKDLIDYLKSQTWCCFKNNNRSLFARTLWIKGATKYKHKVINNLPTEDITLYYKDNLKQVRGFNGDQKPLDDITTNRLSSTDLIKFINEYKIINEKMKPLSEEIILDIEADNFIGFKKRFKRYLDLNCQIYAYEYLLSSLGDYLYESLTGEELQVFNRWKNYEQNNNSKMYEKFFGYIIKILEIKCSVPTLILYSHVDEILKILDSKLNPETLLKEINIRKRGFVLLNLQDKKYANKIIADDMVIDEVKKIFIERENDANNPGYVKGKATFEVNAKIFGQCIVIKNNYDLVKDVTNKILVCPVTTAQEVYQYLDAKALIVNHGGVLSHAAIFSREIHKPCLMGCEIATKVFNTGDIIEIDFTKEIAYKVSQK